MPKGLVKKDTYKAILRMIRDGHSAPEIYRALGLSPQQFNYYIRNLEHQGLVVVKRTYPRTFALTLAGERALTEDLNLKVSPRVRVSRPKTPAQISVHDVKVKIPILRRGEPLPTEKEVAIRNWVKKYFRMDIPVPVTVEITPKNVILHFHEMKYPRRRDIIGSIVSDVLRYTYLIASYMNSKFGWVLDVPSARVITQHIAVEMPEVKDHLREGTRVRFDKMARGIDQKEMKQDSMAWVDNTPSERNVETDDIDYTEALLEMPFVVRRMYNEQSEFFRLHNELIARMNRLIATTEELLQNLDARSKP